MRHKRYLTVKKGIYNALALLLATVAIAIPAQAELATLFTTPQERQIINSNRYRNAEVQQSVTTRQPQKQEIQRLAQEEVTRNLTISGITIASSGGHTVWINGQAYEDDDRLEDQSKIKIVTGREIRVRITAPDGKQYFATSGETLEMTYLATVEN